MSDRPMDDATQPPEVNAVIVEIEEVRAALDAYKAAWFAGDAVAVYAALARLNRATAALAAIAPAAARAAKRRDA